MGNYKIPYDRNNTPMYVVRGWEANRVVMKDNKPFKDILEFVGFRTTPGGSSHSVWHSNKFGTEVVMFLSDLGKAMPDVTTSMLAGIFSFQKRSDKYGIKLIEVDLSLLPGDEETE